MMKGSQAGGVNKRKALNKSSSLLTKDSQEYCRKNKKAANSPQSHFGKRSHAFSFG
jgi:hypothetical protein